MFFDIETVLILNWLFLKYRTVFTSNCVQTKSVIILNWISWIRTVWINWIAWNRNVFSQLNCVLMLNRIVWNKTDYLYENEFDIKYPTKVDMP